MIKFAGGALLVTVWVLVEVATVAVAQHPGTGMSMPKTTLLLAQLDAKQVAGGSSSRATGTGAFLLDPRERALTYRLTYEGLATGDAKRIALYNFGKGKNGELIETLCDAAAKPCPRGSWATIAGRLERGAGRVLDNPLIGEFDSGRVYVEILGVNGKPEIRGQLGSNNAMVPFANYTANLAPIEGIRSKGTGTAIFSETYLPDGKVSVFYAVTVAGMSGRPINIVLVGNSVGTTRPFTPQMALPGLDLHQSQNKAGGGSFSGYYEVNSNAPDALFPKRLLSRGAPAGILVATSRNPDGELYGALMPVQ